MNSPDITAAVLAEHRKDLRRQIRGSAMAALARCCSPSAWASAARRIASPFTGTERSAPCTG